MLNMLTKHKIFLSGQTEDLVPADKVLYNLRNATGTVNNYGLIASSILSKKFSILGTHVFLDVKYGSGAFCDTYAKALKLVKYLVAIAKKMKRKLTIFLTDMDQPLGKTIGNAIEVLEAQKFLAGDKDYDQDLKELIYKIASTIIMSYDKKISYQSAYNKVDYVIKSKMALNKFYE
jgi:thymidine phosphorylase